MVVVQSKLHKQTSTSMQRIFTYNYFETKHLVFFFNTGTSFISQNFHYYQLALLCDKPFVPHLRGLQHPLCRSNLFVGHAYLHGREEQGLNQTMQQYLKVLFRHGMCHTGSLPKVSQASPSAMRQEWLFFSQEKSKSYGDGLECIISLRRGSEHCKKQCDQVQN